MLNPTQGQQISWFALQKRKLSWTFHTKQATERLIVDVEFWVGELEKLSADTIPPIMTRFKIPSAEIMEISSGNNISETKAKGQLLIENRNENDTNASTANLSYSQVWAHKDTGIEYSRLRFKALSEQTNKEGGYGDLGGSKRRQWAQFLDEKGKVKEALVIVEFKDHPLGRYNQSDVDQAIKQLRSLVAVLRIAAKHTSTFQILYCHGFYETRNQYGLIYQLPPSITTPRIMQCESLTNILLSEKYSELLAANIQCRCDLAKALALTLFHIHSVQWLHKSFAPDNILLFGRKSFDGVNFDWTSPFIVGFDASRNIRDVSQRLPTAESWEERVYIHPERQRDQYSRFQKLFDIYSLGVVMLEIGRLRSFKDKNYKESDWSNLPAKQVQQRLVNEAKELRKIVGITYEEIVTTCLQGEFDVIDDDADETQLSDAFRTEVCEKFQQICY